MAAPSRGVCGEGESEETFAVARLAVPRLSGADLPKIRFGQFQQKLPESFPPASKPLWKVRARETALLHPVQCTMLLRCQCLAMRAAERCYPLMPIPAI